MPTWFNSRTAAKEIQNELVNFVSGFHPEYFITLATNRDWSVSERGWGDVIRAVGAIDRKSLGCRYHELHAAERSLVFAFPEKGHQRTLFESRAEYMGLHFHLLLKFPAVVLSRLTTADLTALVGRRWASLQPAGTSDVQAVYDEQRVASYCCKRLLDDDLGMSEWRVIQGDRIASRKPKRGCLDRQVAATALTTLTSRRESTVGFVPVRKSSGSCGTPGQNPYCAASIPESADGAYCDAGETL